MGLKGAESPVLAGLVILLLTVSASPAAEEEFTFTASVEEVRVDVTHQFALTVSVSGTGAGEVGEPDLPPLKDFDVLGRSTSQSSQFSIVNGKISSSKTIDYIYTLRPKATGDLVIPSATVKYKDKEYRTEPITIHVSEGSLPSQQVPAKTFESLPKEEIFLDGTADRTVAYVGEQVSMDYSLYVAVGLSNVRLGNIPSYAGFWSEEVFSARRLDFRTRVVRGKRYEVAPIKSVALFPTTSGDFEIEPMSIVCDVAARNRDPFRNLWGATRTITVRSSPVTIKVKPLPEVGRPALFSGATGSFEFDMEISSESVSVGEPLEVLIRASGEGNIRTLQLPDLPDIEEFKSYEPEISVDVSKSKGRVSGTKTHKYMLVPNSQGRYVIPSLQFSFFDPRQEKYRTISTEEVSIVVGPGRVEDLSGLTTRGPVQVLGKDILYIKPKVSRMGRGRVALYQNRSFLLLQFVPAIALFFAFFLDRHRRLAVSDTRYQRSRKARNVARARIRSARQALGRGDAAATAAEVSRALVVYVGDKLNLNASGLTMERLLGELGLNGATETAVRDFKECMEKCDLLRFASSDEGASSAEAVLDLADRAIDSLEESGFGCLR